MKSSHFFTFLSGAILGAAAALLLAPAKGEQTRAKIKEVFDDSVEGVKKEFKERVCCKKQNVEEGEQA